MAGKMKRSEASSSSRSSNSNHHRAESVVVDYGKNKSTCGYCRSKARTSISHGLWAHSVTINDYQDLLDRGWRRSGCFLYKPEMERTCCPAYTIRLKAGDFVHSKEQLRVSRRMQRFLDGALECKQPVEPNASKDTHGQNHLGVSISAPKNSGEKDGEEKILNYLSDQVDKAVHSCLDSGEFRAIQCPKASVKKVLQAKRKLLAAGSEDLLYSSNIAFQLAAAMRQCVTDKKEAHQGRELGHIAEENGSSPKLIAEKLESSLNQLGNTSGLSVRACNGHLNFYSVTKPASSDGSAHVVSNFKGTARSESKGSSLKNNSEYTQVKRRRLEIRLKRASFDSEEYALYKRYQMMVHNDTPDHVTEASYKKFLVDTPLIYVPPTNDGTVPPCGFGSFHQQYVIDGKLVAVGVIDILPKCLSSKYLFWDPDFAFLSLGKYSALQEINWVKENQLHCPTLQYYYLGYYIHSCSKMRYKAAYRPSELLCPLRYRWVPFDISKHLLDRNKYAVLSDCTVSQDRDSSSLHASEDVMEIQYDDNDQDSEFMYDEGMIEPEFESSDNEPHLAYENKDAGNVLIGLKESRVRFKDIKQAFGPTERSYLESQLSRYTEVVGEELAGRMVYSID
ncbi:PREDICTED: arginyl-tRNA--protein transferase 2 isoform X1 [Fragaria vesca subsp. vesca]|uniref:arginyl-tRNA--protein transferase 2 isoform X1 n=1 Tax=Fragaria vesca subsp. vesca TaxID=101020 RepID=UPI0002C2FAE2|nr:PREDICTED: arginyl-tRNA--protein transferase 2 isoform X1 [Fragaria vesca subsp. vesca]